ncbi:MAG: hypothetical protein F6K39_02065 [Okeania sp. SIO3B3]|nr:hypothetical protein [Okeania sp. SIO3B3]
MFFSVLLGSSSTQAAEPQLVDAPENPEFTTYMQQKQFELLQDYSVLQSVQVKEKRTTGFIPSPLVLPPKDVAPVGFDMLQSVQMLPSKYDLRQLGRLTPIRNQGGCGACWAFSALASVESVLMGAEAWDFSENNMKNEHGFNYGPCAGGNFSMAAAYLARGQGPVNEQDDPYQSSTSPKDVLAQKLVQGIKYLPGRTSSLDNDEIKRAVMEHGAVSVSMHWEGGSYNGSKRAYHYPGTMVTNHGVNVVGWDDDYPAGNFKSPPPGNGAFIVRNSWGSGWGESGYFYISYYDNRTAKSTNIVVDQMLPADQNRNVYQYDEMGWITSTGYGSESSWMANVFTAEGQELLETVAFYAPKENTQYRVEIHLNPNNGPLSNQGAVVSQSGTMASRGLRSVALQEPVALEPGQRFAVAVWVKVPGYSFPLPVERRYKGYAENVTHTAGQSYISNSGSNWVDYSVNKGNVCVKAYTKNVLAVADADGDSMLDSWEQNHFDTLSRNGLGDFDNDGASDVTEHDLGTNPAKPDTDDDMMPDGWEIQYDLDPLVDDSMLDADQDGGLNIDEFLNGTDPRDPNSNPNDLDMDGLPDSWERQYFGNLNASPEQDMESDGLQNQTELEYGTDPTKADTDGDTMPDNWEVTFGLNPLANDAELDADGDQLTNVQEYLAFTNPQDSTNTLNDVDEDGLPDGWEWQWFGNLNQQAEDDPDADGLTNAQEQSIGLEPNNPDTDGDNALDGADNCRKTANASQLDADLDGYGNRCDYDLDNDGYVSVLDLMDVRRFLGATPGSAKWVAAADFDGDDYISVLDLMDVRRALGDYAPFE